MALLCGVVLLCGDGARDQAPGCATAHPSPCAVLLCVLLCVCQPVSGPKPLELLGHHTHHTSVWLTGSARSPVRRLAAAARAFLSHFLAPVPSPTPADSLSWPIRALGNAGHGGNRRSSLRRAPIGHHCTLRPLPTSGLGALHQRAAGSQCKPRLRAGSTQHCAEPSCPYSGTRTRTCPTDRATCCVRATSVAPALRDRHCPTRTQRNTGPIGPRYSPLPRSRTQQRCLPGTRPSTSDRALPAAAPTPPVPPLRRSEVPGRLELRQLPARSERHGGPLGTDRTLLSLPNTLPGAVHPYTQAFLSPAGRRTCGPPRSACAAPPARCGPSRGAGSGRSRPRAPRRPPRPPPPWRPWLQPRPPPRPPPRRPWTPPRHPPRACACGPGAGQPRSQVTSAA
jgi:hypothetical protein